MVTGGIKNRYPLRVCRCGNYHMRASEFETAGKYPPEMLTGNSRIACYVWVCYAI